MKGLGKRREEVVFFAVAAVLLLTAAWLSLPPSPPAGGSATSAYITATRAYDDAVAAGDAGKAANWVTGNALIELRSQISTDSQEALVIKTTRSPAEFELLSGSDGAQFVQVRESGVQHLEIAQAPGNVVIATRDRTYSRVLSLTHAGSHYQLSNLSETSAPAGWWDLSGGWLIRALLVGTAVGIAFIAVLRRRRAAWAPSAAARLAAPPPVVALPPEPVEPVVSRTVRCFGGLAITDNGEDLTTSLLARRVVAFIWMYLLALEIQRPGTRTSRAVLAAEIFPGLPSQTQRERLRDRLRDIRTDLPESLASSVLQVGEAIAFEPSRWDIDAVELRGLAHGARSSSIESVTSRSADLERAWSGVFLQEWEDLERVTEGRGTSHEFIADLRVELEASLVDTLMVGVERLLSLGDAAEAVRVAQRANDVRPDREDVRNGLARAYAQAGRHSAADSVDR